MPVVPYRPEHEPAVAAFNERLRHGGSDFSFRPSAPGAADTWAAYVATDGDAVRGGYIAVPHPFVVGTEESTVHHLKLPLSEGSVDPAYNAIGVQLLVDAQRRHPLLFALGMGGRANPLPKMLESLRWRLEDGRFFFRVQRPARFLREVAFLRTSPGRRLLLDVAAYSGLGLGILPFHASRDRMLVRRRRSEESTSPGPWCDHVWDRGRATYGFAMRRDHSRLAELYPEPRFLHVRVRDRDTVVGWAVMLDTQLHGHKQFGGMRLGSIVDAFAAPDGEAHVVAAVTRVLRRRGADLVVTNQTAPAWCRAMLANGYLEGPSNYTLALSKKLAARVGAGAIHVTRGDGDGPINL